MQGVNIEKVVWLLLTMFNSSENDCMSSNISDEFAQDDMSVTSYYTCPNCGASIELIDPSDKDKKDYPYWNGN